MHSGPPLEFCMNLPGDQGFLVGAGADFDFWNHNVDALTSIAYDSVCVIIDDQLPPQTLLVLWIKPT